MPHADEAQLHAYLDRDAEYADPTARKALGRHIADCSTCSALLKEVRQIHAASAELLKVARPARRAMPSFDDVVRRANELRATASPPSDPHSSAAEPEIADVATHDPAESVASQPVTWIEPDHPVESVDERRQEEEDEEALDAARVSEGYLYDPEAETPVSYEAVAEDPVSTTDHGDSDIEFIEMSQPVEDEGDDTDDDPFEDEDVVASIRPFGNASSAHEDHEEISDAPTEAEPESVSSPIDESGEHESWDWLRRGADDHLTVVPNDATMTDEQKTDSDVDGLRISHDVGLEHDWMTRWTPAPAPGADDDTSTEVPDENEGAIDAPDLSLNHSFAAAETAEHEIEVPIAPIPPVAPPPTAAQRRSSSAHRGPRRAKRKRGTRILALAATVVIAAGIGVWYGRPYIMERFGVGLGGFTDADVSAEPVVAADEKAANEAPARTLADARENRQQERAAASGDSGPVGQTQRRTDTGETEAQALRSAVGAAERDRPAPSATTPPPPATPAQPTLENVATVSGIVREVATNRPVPEAQVVVEGTGLATTTDPSGRYRLAQVPVGQSRIRTRAIGFNADTTVVSLTGGREATVDVALRPSAVALDEVAVTGGREERAAAATGMNRRSATEILGGPLVIVPELPIERIEESPAGGVRVTQRLGNGASLTLDIRLSGGTYVSGARVENFRVMPSAGQETIASARFGSYLITARANVSADELAALMRRLAESPDSD